MKSPSHRLHRSRPRRILALGLLLALSLAASCGKKQPERQLDAPKQPVNPHYVTLTWTASKSKVHGYNVYRLRPTGPPEKLTDGIVLGTEYTDHTAQGGETYTYFVTSVDMIGVESKPSGKTTVTVPTTITPPAQPPASPAAEPSR